MQASFFLTNILYLSTAKILENTKGEEEGNLAS